MSVSLPEQPFADSQAFLDWYGPGNGSPGLVCPLCFAMVPMLIEPAQGHVDWHRQHGG